MAKNRKGKRRLSEIMVWVISVLVILSMAVGFLFMVLGPPDPGEIPAETPPALDDIEEMIDGAEIIVITPAPDSTQGE